MNENSLIKMKIEFKPGLILNAIISQKSLILKDMPKVKTIVLERFNELFSGQHNLTLVEDIPNTFTSKNKKELKDFNKDFRIIATCKTGEEKNLSEALLSRFTVISIKPYTEKEEQEVLKITAVKNQDIDEIKKLTTTTLTLTEAKNCLEISKSLDLLLENQHEDNLKLALFMWYKGNIERREKRINDIKKQFKININDYEIDKSPFEKSEKAMEDGIYYIKSKITNLEYRTLNDKLNENDNEENNIKKKYRIVFTRKFSEMCDLIHFGITTDTPIIFEGEPGQGKQTAIKYIADLLGLQIINIVISKTTKVDDLLLKTIITKDEEGEIDIKNKKTELYEAIECLDQYPKKLIVFQGLNNASPSVFDSLSSIFKRKNENTKILLPNGSIIQKKILKLLLYLIKIKNLQKKKFLLQYYQVLFIILLIIHQKKIFQQLLQIYF